MTLLRQNVKNNRQKEDETHQIFQFSPSSQLMFTNYFKLLLFDCNRFECLTNCSLNYFGLSIQTAFISAVAFKLFLHFSLLSFKFISHPRLRNFKNFLTSIGTFGVHVNAVKNYDRVSSPCLSSNQLILGVKNIPTQ